MRKAIEIIEELIRVRQKCQKEYHTPYNNGIIDGLTLAKVMLISNLNRENTKNNGQD